MIMYAQYLMDRYLGKKGQGLTEYAIILLLVVLIGVTIYNTSSLKDTITSIYSTINTDLGSIKSGSTSTT